MCDTFWCRGCQQHKKLAVRSATHKVGGALCCNGCSEQWAKRMQPVQVVTRDGVEFAIKSEHVRTSRIRVANRRAPAETVKRLIAQCPAQ
jgi:hypothetical protein